VKQRLYNIYKGMKRRCYNKNYEEYHNYGGRGIKICKEWLDNFQNFYRWSIQNGYQDNLTIDRINVDGNYEPKNCRWVVMKVQQNNRRNNHYVIDPYTNEKMSLAEICDKYHMPYNLVNNRLWKMHWDLKRALEEPAHKKHEYVNEKLYRMYKRKVKKNCCEEWKDYFIFKKWCIGHHYCEETKNLWKNNNDVYNPKNCEFISDKEMHIRAGKLSAIKRKVTT
jgi:hypothetical protein